jgi:hypothetical protein
MRGGAVSTESGEGEPSNMRDWVATLRSHSTRTEKRGQKGRKENGPVVDRSVGKRDENRELLFACGSGNVGVLLLKTLDAAGCVDQLLLTGEERVTARADFDAQHVAFDGRSRLESMSARTVHSDGMIVGVDTGFHCSPIYRGRSAREPKRDGYSRVARSRDNL